MTLKDKKSEMTDDDKPIVKSEPVVAKSDKPDDDMKGEVKPTTLNFEMEEDNPYEHYMKWCEMTK